MVKPILGLGAMTKSARQGQDSGHSTVALREMDKPPRDAIHPSHGMKIKISSGS
jgi:hypothetical protein